jgi:Protein of unknown function (DUF1566)
LDQGDLFPTLELNSPDHLEGRRETPPVLLPFYGGFGDWYLPAVRELQVLQASAVAIGNFLAADYWSSSELGPSDLDSAMQVDFTDGEPANKVKTNSQDVRCVRRN